MDSKSRPVPRSPLRKLSQQYIRIICQVWSWTHLKTQLQRGHHYGKVIVSSHRLPYISFSNCYFGCQSLFYGWAVTRETNTQWRGVLFEISHIHSYVWKSKSCFLFLYFSIFTFTHDKTTLHWLSIFPGHLL